MREPGKKTNGYKQPQIGKRGMYGKIMRPVGSEYVGKDGYILVKVAEYPEKPGSKDNWVLKQKHIWEKFNNKKVPRGYVVMFKDGNKRNFSPENLYAAPRSVMQRMNSIAHEQGAKWSDADSFEAVRLMAEIDIQRTKREAQKPRRCSVCGCEFVPDKCAGSNLAVNKKTCRNCLNNGHKANSKGKAQSCPN